MLSVDVPVQPKVEHVKLKAPRKKQQKRKKLCLEGFHSPSQCSGTCCPLIAETPEGEMHAPQAELHACSTESWRIADPITCWAKIRSVVDTGASDSCGPESMAPHTASREPAGSRRGLVYNAAAKGSQPLTMRGSPLAHAGSPLKSPDRC